jgi:hypothetical protein
MTPGDAHVGQEIVLGPAQECRLGSETTDMDALVAGLKKRLEEEARGAKLSVREYARRLLGEIIGVPVGNAESKAHSSGGR